MNCETAQSIGKSIETYDTPGPPTWNSRYLFEWYAAKAQTSLAPLSRFRGSHITTAHEQQWCRVRSYAKAVHAIANEIDKRNWQSVNHIPGIHDNGPPDHGLWRLTLTAYITVFLNLNRY